MVANSTPQLQTSYRSPDHYVSVGKCQFRPTSRGIISNREGERDSYSEEKNSCAWRMTDFYGRMPNKDGDDNDYADRCRERRRRRIQMRRLSSAGSSMLTAAASSLREGAAADPIPEPPLLVSSRNGKRPHVSDGVVHLLTSSSSSSGDDPDLPAPADSSKRREPEPVYGVMSVTGRSREMEDAVDVRTSLCRPEVAYCRPVHFFGVFDGHGGSHVAVLLSSKMHVLLEEELMRAKRPEENGSMKQRLSMVGGSNGGDEEKWREAMKMAFRRADEMAVTICPCGRSGARCTCHPMDVALGGSTAVVAVLTPDHIVLGNCGDSRAVLCRGGRATPLTRDHKPERSDEHARILALGGQVIFLDGHRVQGILAMSRAIGDKLLKPYVTAEPETVIVRRDPKDEFLIIASDGLWDVLTNELACEIVSWCLHEGSPQTIDLNSGPIEEEETDHPLYPSRSALAAALLTRLALGRKSSDNISVIVVDLKRS
ncbi:hypothetical protein SAY87_024281 [Trapa incisa]|uniref:protein-serine/threonine phosphatase n=1 Tax=Trapa incisa TaxID=236973 RepID=A0AAN7JFT4_9MYRT|nr:hypothetical protein SAY87_024281 [Trapa incisa]